MLQQTLKVGHWQIPRLQFLRRDQRRLRLPRVGVDSRPYEEHKWPLFLSPTTKIFPHFSTQTNTFLGKNRKLRLPKREKGRARIRRRRCTRRRLKKEQKLQLQFFTGFQRGPIQKSDRAFGGSREGQLCLFLSKKSAYLVWKNWRLIFFL